MKSGGYYTICLGQGYRMRGQPAVMVYVKEEVPTTYPFSFYRLASTYTYQAEEMVSDDMTLEVDLWELMDELETRVLEVMVL